MQDTLQAQRNRAAQRRALRQATLNAMKALRQKPAAAVKVQAVQTLDPQPAKQEPVKTGHL
jgi:hypothetical protein